jgi:ribonucleoside-triphosphate reductase
MSKYQSQSNNTVASTELSKEAQTILNVAKEAKFKSLSKKVPESVKKLAAESKKYFRNQLAEFVYYRTYSRWMDEEERRETWIETVDRYLSFMKENLGDKLTGEEYSMVREAILKQEAMPSMRLLQFAGKAARATNVCAYNCSFIAPSQFQDFGEIMYILMCGSGVGYTVETKNVEKLPVVKVQTGQKLETHIVEDSREGWANALVLGIKTWYSGKDIDFDFSQVRPAGARLNTFGGRASGPAPLQSVLVFAKEKITQKQGKKLDNIDVHDLICKIAEVVVSGGVRRSSLISLSNLDDQALRNAKVGQFWNTNPERAMANNSAVYEEKPSVEQFLDEWLALIRSGSGERGIFNRGGLAQTLPARRLKYLKNDLSSLGTNPCGEIILQSKQFCNLSEVVARSEDTEADLLRKIRVAAILGTYQSSLVNFPYLSKEWQKHCKEERLLGVSITGQWDCPAVRNADTLQKLKKEALKINKEYSKKFGVPESTCVTCVKPSGTVSQTVDCASGIHPRYAPYYIRRIRISTTDPLFQMMKDQGIPYYPEVGQDKENATTWVLEFPVKAPAGSVYKDELTALQQLEHWKMVKENFTEHNPSVTIYVGETEWIEVGNWLYQNWEIVGGISFLPRNNHVYELAPYEEINEERYETLKEAIGDIDFSLIMVYEKEDATEVKKELACAGGACEI